MQLNDLWFILIGVLFTGFFFLEGFDYGVGILLPFIAKNDTERRVVINSIGPVWDANEVWLLTAGGAMFAAFPHWYATMFSGFYLPLFLILLALIVRGVAFEFRSKMEDARWRKTWDYAIFIGSLLPAILFGVAFANIVRGLAIDDSMTYVGTFFDLLNPYSLVGGFVTFAIFTLHGALFLELKTDGVIRERAKAITRPAWIATLVLIVVFVGFSFIDTNMFEDINIIQIVALVVTVGALVFAGFNLFRAKFGLAFIANGLVIVGVVVLLFSSLFPNVMPSSLDPAFSLTVYNASSTQYTLSIMTVVAFIFVPIVLMYQGWTYWVFRKRVTLNSHLEY
ncbi:MAG: cytochrome d ubiquinol oxidase subunit II [Anaerolineae bacterium]|jgi:cytochrome d ubiquinol oxidase subunit II|nr:cytochrome d ubiquinol oxidase subunit II [Anaerolineae bacterium]